MRFKLFAAALLAAFGLAAFADQAFADDDLRAQIREEIEAYEKEKKADPKNDKTFKVYWSDGLRFKSANGKIKLKIGGRIMFDTWFIDDENMEGSSPDSPNEGLSPIDDSPSGVEFRRVRLYNSGEIGKHFEYKLQFDFASNEVLFRDVYIGLKKLRDCYGCGVPNIKIGHFKVGQGLETLTSSKYITFMERSWVSIFYPDRSTGIQFWDVFRGGSLGYQAGIDLNDTAGFNQDQFTEGDGFFNAGLGYSARVWWAPWFDCNCAARRLHLGISASYRTDINDRVRLRARPPSHLHERIVNTGTLRGVDNAWILGAELAWVFGPWSVQAEYVNTTLEDNEFGLHGDPTFTAWYVYASYWLTGEARNWKDGVFKRTKPCCNWLDKDCCCKGGWELAARYEAIDLTDGNVNGGEATAITLGVNWHWNPNMRVMFNYYFADADPVGPDSAFAGDEQGFGMRFQVDF